MQMQPHDLDHLTLSERPCLCDSKSPSDLVFLVLLEYAELRCGKITRLGEIPDLLLDKHEAFKAEKAVLLVAVPCVHVLIELAYSHYMKMTATHALTNPRKTTLLVTY